MSQDLDSGKNTHNTATALEPFTSKQLDDEIKRRERERTEIRIGDYVTWKYQEGILSFFKTHSWCVSGETSVDGVDYWILRWSSRKVPTTIYTVAVVPKELLIGSRSVI